MNLLRSGAFVIIQMQQGYSICEKRPDMSAFDKVIGYEAIKSGLILHVLF